MTDRSSALAGAVQGETLTFRGLLAAIGGWLGVVESIVPPLVFVVLYQVAAIGAAPDAVPRGALVPIVVVPLACSGLLLAYRALRRQKVGAAVAGAVVVGVSALLVLVTGDANSNYVPGFFINGVYGLAFLVSLLVRRPLVGIAAGVLLQQGGWRSDARRRRLCAWLTAAWVALFGIRLAVELPLFFAGHQVVALGIARIALGVPLYALVLVVTVLGVQAAFPRRAAVPPSAR
ncbi:DUF3159 domain-containing protein [Amnibacterium sp.]|uniref:DUF3159 domain-containing protein n=1 Tax=Amnibacterium sp. TaxID=1872496 RepID=UPI0026279AE6|nr:DUF3159 domain-containing protein [Amnibacterium sp.]MCU1472765.1 hypothetical protein [Amnibacterium sp.]